MDLSACCFNICGKGQVTSHLLALSRSCPSRPSPSRRICKYKQHASCQLVMLQANRAKKNLIGSGGVAMNRSKHLSFTIAARYHPCPRPRPRPRPSYTPCFCPISWEPACSTASCQARGSGRGGPKVKKLQTCGSTHNYLCKLQTPLLPAAGGGAGSTSRSHRSNLLLMDQASVNLAPGDTNHILLKSDRRRKSLPQACPHT